MKILGIDPGYGRCGICVIDSVNKPETVLFSDCVETKGSIDMFERFKIVSDAVLSAIDLYEPKVMAIEKLFFDLIEVTDKRGAVGKCLISRATMEVGGVDKETTAWLQEVFEKSERLLCRLIERGQAAGEISSFRSPKELAQFLAITVQGMQVMARFERDNKKFRAIAETELAALDYEK